MRDPQRLALRAQAALRILIERGEAIQKADVWNEVAALFPLEGVDAELISSGRPRGEVDWAFRTAEFVKAGWLVKGGTSGWTITDAGRDAFARIGDPLDLLNESRELYTAWEHTRKSERTRALASRIVPHDAGEEQVIKAAGLVVERGLVASESIFSPGRLIWTSKVVGELSARFAGTESAPGTSFVEQLQGQLDGASDDAKLLMSELVALQLLPVSTDVIGALKKAERVESVLTLMQHPVQIPTDIREAFKFGAFHPGTRMLTMLGAALTILVNFVAQWTEISSSRQEELLDDPWALREFVLQLPGERFPSQRSALMFLLHPQTFVSIVSDAHKRLIHEAFLGEVTSPSGDLDRDLRDITIALQVKESQPVNYYASPLREVWQSAPSPEPEPGQLKGKDGQEDITLIPATDFPAADATLSELTLIDAPWLQARLDQLERRRQVIFYGPPGTGKTFIAKALARHISGGADPVIVQFHPSYAYEDFVQGYRPTVEDGILVYRLKNGPFIRIAREARDNPERSYVLVIDEINRGNIAKIFGELYFLLEYRDESIALLYDEQPFQLPSNVFIIGTMNTTDRSIALLDAAMRRRFAFVELHPDVAPIDTVLNRWLERAGLDQEPARLLKQLNQKIVDVSARIGPSYLMPSDEDLSEERLQEIWTYELLPLLAEFHYGEGLDLEKTYGIDTLRGMNEPSDPGE